MERFFGTVSRGVRAPIIKNGDDIVKIVTETVLKASENEGVKFRDKDVIAMTEAVVARAQNNYVTIDDIATDVKNKFGGETVGIVFPILSRNRFSVCLKGISKGAKKVVIMLSYPADEVGNHLISIDDLDAKGVNPYTDVLTESKYRELFGNAKHTFTGVDYVEYYRSLVTEMGAECEIIFANNPKAILPYTKNVLCCDIHTRARTKRQLIDAGAEKVYGLDNIMDKSINGSGYNAEYGLLGSNKATEESIKLFPRDCQPIVDAIKENIFNATGKRVEVMVYGDGAFKDPVGKIWELADPVVSPAYTENLKGTPNELKLKYLADNDFKDLKGDELKEAIKTKISQKDSSVAGQMGTTPRRLTDLIGSLCDLTSGSGDKGTPIIWISGYFDNYTDEY